MKVESGVLVYEYKQCFTCMGSGRYTPHVPCPNQHKAQRGKPCAHCGATHKFDHHWLPQESVQCPKCLGTLIEREDRYDYMPVEILRSIPVKVLRSTREATWNESWLGHGCLWSTVDYGAHRRLSDEKLIEKVREHFSVQACAVVNEQDELPPFIALLTSDTGYSVRSAWKMGQVLIERGESEGFQHGMEVYHRGGHGTMAALFKEE